MSFEMWAAVLGVAVIFPSVFLYNRLIAERNLARQGYADIDVQLKRRADLVPQPLEARFGAERSLGAGLRQLVLLQENYPQLKADTTFLDLARRLADVEDHLQYARRFYNGAVKHYVTRLESFPDIVIAKLFRFRAMPFFETDDRATPDVKL
jgi:LemA protein